VFIRFLDGPLKGQVRDMQDAGALELIRAGRAENPYLDTAPGAPTTEDARPHKKQRKGSR
jgi:hypothetical protein